jgi:exosortase
MTRPLMTRLGMFGIYCGCVLLINFVTISQVVALSRTDATASHVIAIPFVSILLIYLRRREVFSSVSRAPGRGGAVIVAGLTLTAIGRAFGSAPDSPALTLQTIGLMLLLIGGFLLFFGGAAFRSALFPLLFLAFAIPIPRLLLSAVVDVLKTGSAETVAVFFSLTGTPFHREGFVFALPNFVIEIADACSGIRSSIALLLTSSLAGYLFLRNRWTRVLLIALVIPFAILKNGIRIATLSLLAEHVDARYLTGQLHHEGGIVFFVITLVLLWPFFALLQKTETARL